MTADSKALIRDPQKGTETPFDRDKLRQYLESLSQGLNPDFVKVDSILNKVVSGLPDSLTVRELMDLTSEVCASLTTVHYDHSTLGARVLACHLQKQVCPSFSANIDRMRNYVPNGYRRFKKLISKDVHEIVMKHREVLDKAIESKRDFDMDYFGFKTMERSYLLKIDGVACETPQYLFMRVALGIHKDNIARILETYELMSLKYFIHASPTLFNSGTETPNLSSCFLLAMEGDSIDGIFRTVHKSALISKAAGGIGFHASNIRAAGTYISGTNGTSNGLVPMLQVFNSTAKYVDQGGNKRPGAFCVYIEPWHADIFEFLDLRKNHGKEESRARDLFYALWIPDLFMEKVEQDSEWCLFSQDECPGLTDCYGTEFAKLYCKYEMEGRYTRKIRAQKLWHAILTAQTETGNPFMLYKDACNRKSNQQNLGTIKSSNLCCEIVEYSSDKETAVCNLGSLALPTFVKQTESGPKFDFKQLHEVCKFLTRNLDTVIDVGLYPIPEAEKSNKRHRPVAVGVQGLADVFFKLRYPFGSPESRELNIQIFETIYHASLEMSNELAVENGPYESYEGSPISKGVYQFDFWKTKPTNLWDWDKLKSQIGKHGVRNSLLVALMPTASTSQIFGFTECFEPITSNIYSRRVLSGEFQVVNKYLVDDLVRLNLWDNDLKNEIVQMDGSVQTIERIPREIRDLYKTVWEMPQRVIIDMAADRSPFIDQSQSMNLFLRNPTMSKLTSMHFYAWKKGLKTGIYYLRTQAAASAIKFTLNPSYKRSVSEPTDSLKKQKSGAFNIYDTQVLACKLDDPENCESCSS
ncbi:hypothetical protein OGAPHI_003745 [Ogataea philodendri]|uniref:Ribonucleoside-diphosphate reductase n=1 Tax=Ogataea philodendri TaxID=1378263 RepID=A0A9P8P4A7_9ASCO|nr:uncharacterized protein OGAPHI_003745 [Ogataea philodendri]KAH3665558.1 hypothetical protein OGAPHI_003745 [Ogataea philodendri]